MNDSEIASLLTAPPAEVKSILAAYERRIRAQAAEEIVKLLVDDALCNEGTPYDSLSGAIRIVLDYGAKQRAGASRESGADAPTCAEISENRVATVRALTPLLGLEDAAEAAALKAPRGRVQAPSVVAEPHHCDALCRDVEDERDRLFAELERMRPVVEAAKALREAQRRDVIDRPITPHDLFVRAEAFGLVREAFATAVDTYEEQERGTDD